jgi:hypothetical protein
VAWFNSQTKDKFYRVTYGKDPVTRLPARNIGYKHVATEVFYENDFQNYVICNAANNEEDLSCALKNPLTLKLEDHSIYMNY